MNIDLNKKMYNKIHQEFLDYIDKIRKLSPSQIENKIYELTCKQEIVDMFYDSDEFTKYSLLQLLKKDNSLEFLYKKWNGKSYNDYKNSEEITSEQIQECIKDTVSELGTDYVFDVINKTTSKYNSELLETISNSLSSLDNYDFCINIKDKYMIKEFDMIDIAEILTTKDGVKDLYYFFRDLINNEHLNYLKDIMVIDSKSVEDINKIIIPQLKRYINIHQKQNKCEER